MLRVGSRQCCRTVGTVDKQVLLARGFAEEDALPPAARTSNRDEVHAMQPVEATRTRRRELASWSLTKSLIVEENTKAHVAVEEALFHRTRGEKKGQLDEKALQGGIKANKKAKSSGKREAVELTIEYGLLGEDECQWRAIQDGHKQIIANKRREDDQGKSWCAGLKTQNWASWK
ncbi:hypothetical protein GGI43DRAFT_365236 [Trichoderma evansii]